MSAFQINFGSTEIDHRGRSAPDVLVAMNPAALKDQCRGALKPGGLDHCRQLANSTKRNLEKAKYAVNPLEDGSLAQMAIAGLRHFSALTLESVKPVRAGQ